MCSECTPRDRACLLVGRFFHHFSAIEAELNEAIRELFELGPSEEGVAKKAAKEFLASYPMLKVEVYDASAKVRTLIK
jgi:hypothetical protein